MIVSIAMMDKEIRSIDNRVEQMLDWAQEHQTETEQLTFDSVRLLSCVGDRIDNVSKQGFFRRIWSRFSDQADTVERANTSDLIQMQKICLRFINIISDKQILMPHSMLLLKNILFSLEIQEEEPRKIISHLAQQILERFEILEKKVEQLEVSTNLQGWILGLEEREYDIKIQNIYIRLFHIINDFYAIKSNFWNYNDIIFMRKALRTVKIDPKTIISLKTFIDNLVDEIFMNNIDLELYNKFLCFHSKVHINDISLFIIDNINLPIYQAVHNLKYRYNSCNNIIENLISCLRVPHSEALKVLLRPSNLNMNINLNYEYSFSDIALEILGGIRLANLLTTSINKTERNEEIYVDVLDISSNNRKNEFDKSNIKDNIDNIKITPWKIFKTESIDFFHEFDFNFINDEFIISDPITSRDNFYISTDLINFKEYHCSNHIINSFSIYHYINYKSKYLFYDKGSLPISLYISENIREFDLLTQLTTETLNLDKRKYNKLNNIFPLNNLFFINIICEYNGALITYLLVTDNFKDYQKINLNFRIIDMAFGNGKYIVLGQNFSDKSTIPERHSLHIFEDLLSFHHCVIDFDHKHKFTENIFFIDNKFVLIESISPISPIGKKSTFSNIYFSTNGYIWNKQQLDIAISHLKITLLQPYNTFFNIHSKTMLISNNLFKWKQIDCPEQFVWESSALEKYKFAFNGKYLFFSDQFNDLFYAKLLL